MIDTLYTNGCSWTAGDDLEKDILFSNQPKITINDNPTKIRSIRDIYSWPAKLAKLYNTSVINDAFSGGSNKRIVRTTCDFLQNYPKDKLDNLLVVIGWTTMERDEICVNNRWRIFNSSQQFSSFTHKDLLSHEIKSIDKFQEHYVRDIANDVTNLTHYFQQTYLLANLLENKGVKYYFFNGLPPWWQHSVTLNPTDVFSTQLEMLNTINFEKECWFYQCKKNKLLISDTHHPLVSTHDLWANHLKTAIDNLYFK